MGHVWLAAQCHDNLVSIIREDPNEAWSGNQLGTWEKIGVIRKAQAELTASLPTQYYTAQAKFQAEIALRAAARARSKGQK